MCTDTDDHDTMHTFVVLKNQGFATEMFYGRRKEADKLLDKRAGDADVVAVFLYGAGGLINSITV